MRTIVPVAFGLTLLLAFSAISGEHSSFTMAAKVDKIKIESVEFKDTKLSQAITLIKDMCKKADPDGIGINLSYIAPKDDKGNSLDPVINDMSLDNIPLKDLLRYVCDATGMTYKIDEFAVIVMPKNMAGDRMETRTYKVRPDVVNSINEKEISKDEGISKDKK